MYAQQSSSLQYRPNSVSKGNVYKTTNSNQIIISDIPSYIWYRGCGPTALGMVVGYYDTNGFPDLVVGDAFYQNTNVNNMIANNDHYNDYSLPLDYYPNLLQDNSELGGAHDSNCIADYMFTSWSLQNNYWGWSWSNHIGPAFTQYALQQNEFYQINTSFVTYNSNSWVIYINEIDNNRPVVILVDTDGNGSTDHFVTGIGYNDTTHEYAIYDTWDSDIHWYTYQELSNSNLWGVYGFTKIFASNTISTDEIESSNFSFFPNPTSDKLFLKNITFKTGDSYEIFDSLGKCIKKGNSKEIDMKEFRTGVYSIIISIDKQQFYKKIVKL